MGKFIGLIIAGTFMAVTPAAYAQLGEAVEDLDTKDRGPAEIRGTIQAQPIALFFTGLDTDHDKIVTRAELDLGMDADWRAMEPSVTGKVGAFKIEDWALSTLGSRDAYPTRLSFDSNLDNQVSAAEFKNRLVRTFDDMDEDGNGQLSRAELIFIAAPRIIRQEGRREQAERRPARQQRRN